MGEKVEENVIELPVKEENSKPEPEKVTEESLAEGGFSEKEIAMAKDTGVIAKDKDEESKEEEKDQKAQESEKEEESDNKPEKKDDKSEDDSKADDTEKSFEEEKKLVEGFNKNEKALFFKQKRERRKRQATEELNRMLNVKMAAKDKVIEALKANKPKDEDTFEDEGDIDKSIDEKDDDIVTRGDLKKRDDKAKADKVEAETIEKRIVQQEKDARLEYDDFDEVMVLAREVMENDDTDFFAHSFTQAAIDPKKNAALIAYKIGKQHPDYGVRKVTNKEIKDNKESDKTKRIVNNASKKSSSAALGGGGGSRKVSESDLSVEDMADVSDAQWAKLKPATRERLMRESVV